jgi:hypothetical protein
MQVDIILEVIPTAEQRAERVKTLEDSQSRSTLTKEKEYEIKDQRKVQTVISRRRMRDMHTTRSHLETTARTARAKSRQKARCNCQANPRGAFRNEVYYYQRGILIQDLQVQ